MSDRPPQPLSVHESAAKNCSPVWDWLQSPALLCLLLAGLTFALYFPVTHHDFLNFDDPVYVSNPHVKTRVTMDGVRWAFTTWHPLTWISLMVDVQLLGTGPGGFHLVNLLWHTANAALLFLLLRKLTGALWLSAFVAALFAWHPVQVESVAWIAERKGVLSACFGLLTLMAYAEYVARSRVQSSKSKVWYGITLACFILALLSKPMLVTLPGLMLLLDCWPLKRVGFGGRNLEIWQPLIREKIPFLALSAMSAAATLLLQKQAVQQNGRGVLTDKVVVSWQGEPLELGQRLHHAACEHGLGRAQAKLVVSDGAAWIWNVAQDRWRGAVEVLDFYHASQHVWTLGEAVHGHREIARPWVEKQLHQLRHGRHAAALKTFARLQAGRGAAGQIIRREQNYLAGHAARMNYRAVADRDWPIGSGPVESACLQRQGRFKRSGQSWTPLGLRHLCALIESRQNKHWDQLWNQ